MQNFFSTKLLTLGSCAFRQPQAESRCRLIHGYRLQAKFWFACNQLDNNNWVVDFGSLKKLKADLENQFDHTTIIASHDPFKDKFKELHNVGVIDLRIMDEGVGIEMFAKYCFHRADSMIRIDTNHRCWVQKVEMFEHEQNSAVYEACTHTT